MTVKDDVVLGEGAVVYHPDLVNIYGCQIGSNTRIGTFVEIQSGVLIGSNCKIQSHTFICSGVVIENGVFIGHGVVFANDRHPVAINPDGTLKSNADWFCEPILVRNRASIGSHATILPGVTVGEGALVAAGAVVTHDVPPGALVMGIPARVVRSRS